MNQEAYRKNLQFLTYQRNILTAISILISLTVLSLSIFLFFKSDRVVVVPSVIEKEFWVDGKGVSPTYLEQMGCFLAQLLFNKSAYSAPLQRSILLRHADPEYYGLLKQKLCQEEDALKKQSLSYVFYPTLVKVNTETKEVFFIGDRQAFIQGKQVAEEREGYCLKFSYNGIQLLLKELSPCEIEKIEKC